MHASEDRPDDAMAVPEVSGTQPEVEEVRMPSGDGGPLLELPPECYPDVSNLITEDNAPVDSLYTEKQQRLLTEPLYASWSGPGGSGEPFIVMADVGLFYALKEPPLVPDCLLSVGVERPRPVTHPEGRSYFLWVYGQPPDVVIEIVSDRRGGEDSFKMRQYARLGIIYYAIYDPKNVLDKGVLRTFHLVAGEYVPLPDHRFNRVGLGLILWEGEYEGVQEVWLRWCDLNGPVIPTGRERADQEKQRADQGAEHIRRLEAQLRALGIEPNGP
jgi:Uma2 family endonuclease